MKFKQECNEDLFTLHMKAQQIANALRIVAGDTQDRNHSPHNADVARNMETVFFLAENVDYIAGALDEMDRIIESHGKRVEDVL